MGRGETVKRLGTGGPPPAARAPPVWAHAVAGPTASASAAATARDDHRGMTLRRIGPAPDVLEDCNGRCVLRHRRGPRGRGEFGWIDKAPMLHYAPRVASPPTKGSISHGPLDRLRDRPSRADSRSLARPVPARRLRGREPRRAALEPLQRPWRGGRERPGPPPGPRGGGRRG